MICPNLNDKEYKALAAVVGSAKAHTIWARNNGNPVSLTADGTPSTAYQTLERAYGSKKAIQARSVMFSDAFMELSQGKTDFDINEVGAVELDNGLFVNIVSSGTKNKAQREYSLRHEYIETGEKMESVLQSIGTAFPGFNILRESFDSLKGTKHENARAFVDKRGIHFNMQSMHYDTPIHEAAHIWIHALEAYDNESYQIFMEKVKDSMTDNESLVNLIKEKYPDLTPLQLHYEYAATIGGMASVEHVKAYFEDMNKPVEDNTVKSIWTRIQELFKDLMNNIRNMFSSLSMNEDTKTYMGMVNFENGSLEDIFKALTMDVMEGNNIIGVDATSQQEFIDTYYNNNYSEASNELNDQQVPITSLNHILPYLTNRFDITNMTTENEEFLSNSIHNKMHNNTDGSYSYWDMGEKFTFPSDAELKAQGFSDPFVQRKQLIKDEIISRRTEFQNGFNDKMVFAINSFKKNPKLSLTQHIVDAFEGTRLENRKIQEIIGALRLIGIDQPLSYVMNYKDLANNESLRHLYNPALEGFNPLILVHDLRKGVIDISVIDLAAGDLGRQGSRLSPRQNNIASALGASNNLFPTYSNTKADIRKSLIVMTVAGMNKKAIESGMKLKIRKMGVVGFNQFNIASHLVANTKSAFEESQALLQYPNLQKLFDGNSPTTTNFLKDLANDDTAWNHNTIRQSSRHMLESYYATYRQELGLSQEDVDNMMRDKSFLHHRQAVIEQEQGGTSGEEKSKDFLRDPEHRLLSIYLLESKYHLNINNSQMVDINKNFWKVTNPHNVKHDAIQMFSKAAEETKSIIIFQLNGFKDTFVDLLSESLKSHGKSIKLMGNLPEKIYGHLYRKENIKLQNDWKKHKAGEVVEITMFNKLHGRYDMAAARAAGLTAEDLDLTDFILKTVRDRYIATMKHGQRLQNNPMTDEEIAREVDNKLGQGIIPIIPSTRNEMFRKFQWGKLLEKQYEMTAKGEYNVGEIYDLDYTNINQIFESQKDYNIQLNLMGIEQSSNGINIGRDMASYDYQTMNLEYAMNMFYHDSVRKIELENRLVPLYNNILQWMNVLKYEFNQKNEYTERFLNEYYERIVLRKNRDPNKKMDKLIRNGLNLFSFVALGYRPVVWIRSGYYNLQNTMIQAIATQVFDKIPENDTLNFPNATHFAKANKLFFTDFSKIYQLGKLTSIINSSEMDAIQSIFTTVTDRNAFRTQLAQLGNYYTDVASRLMTMTAFMLKDGSYDAHSFNKQTNTLKYDKTKDKRFYENGKWKSDNDKLLFDTLLKLQQEVGLATSEADMKIGYTFEDANDRFKWFNDKYIIGSMDEYQKILLGNTAMGALFTQFRNYLPDKAFNILSSRRNTSYGAVREVVMNDDNELEVIKKQLEIEGTGASLWYMLEDVWKVVRYKDAKLSDINLTPMQQHNLGVVTAKAVLFTSIFLGLKMMVDEGLSDRDKDKLQWLYGELLAFNMYEELYSNIMPVSGLLDNLMSMITGKANWTRMLKYTGPVYDAIWALELLTDTDDILINQKSRKRVNDMNEKELTEYRKKQAILKEKRRKQQD